MNLRSLAILGSFLFFALPSLAQRDTLSVFIIQGCARCLQTEQFLKTNHIPFRLQPIDDKANYKKLAVLLENEGFKAGQQLTFPVVSIKGKTNYNITELEKFLDSLLADKLND